MDGVLDTTASAAGAHEARIVCPQPGWRPAHSKPTPFGFQGGIRAAHGQQTGRSSPAESDKAACGLAGPRLPAPVATAVLVLTGMAAQQPPAEIKKVCLWTSQLWFSNVSAMCIAAEGILGSARFPERPR